MQWLKKEKNLELYRVIRLFLYSLFILFFLSGCECGDCKTITGNTNNYTTYTSSVVVFGDGCGNYEGSTTTATTIPEPNAQCDDYDGGSYTNRGRWVKVPNISVENGSTFTINAYGSVYYCSYGYDNKNPSPRAIVAPATQKQTFFTYDASAYTASNQAVPENTEIPVQAGQLIILDVEDGNNNKGLAIGENADILADICSDTEYDKFVAGQCRATNGLGLTVYVGNDEIATLDFKSSDKGTYQDKKYRYPNLYKPFIPDSELEDFYTGVEKVYGKNVEPAGPKRYVFLVPENLDGVLALSIAGESGVLTDGSAGSGDGQYNVMVMSAPPACMVQNSIVLDTGKRGALQILIQPSGVNPNQEDTIITEFDSTTSISEYYPELIKFIADKTGVTITSNAAALGELVVSSDYEPDMIVMTEQEYSGRANTAGYIWLKVRDDYYHDNVGYYNAYVEVTSKNNSIVSDFLASITDPVTESLNKTTETIYNNFSQNERFLNIMRMCLMLYIMIYGAQFMLGLSSITVKDAVIRSIKIGVVTMLFEPTSWDFFNTYFFKLFTDGKDYLITAVTGDESSDRSGVFGFIDDIFYVFFAEITWQKLLALMPYLIGIVYIAIFIQVMVIYLIVMAQVFIVYLLTLIGIGLLLSLAPMFMVTMLFERTRNIFLNWVKHLADYALQPVILFAVLYVVNAIFMTFWNSAMDITICYGNVWELDFFGILNWTKGVIGSFSIGCIHYYKIVGGLQIVEMFIDIIILYIFVFVVKGIIAHIPTLTESITGATGSASAISGAASGIVQSGMNLASGGSSVEKYQQRKELSARKEKEEAGIEKVKDFKQDIKDLINGPLKNADENKPDKNKTNDKK